MEYFKSRCRNNLHVILAFSPIGNGMRNIIRSYPSLLYCCTIDCLDKWPDSALKAVAMHFLTMKNTNESTILNNKNDLNESMCVLEPAMPNDSISSVANKMHNIAL